VSQKPTVNGKRLRHFLDEAGLTPTGLVAKSGVSKATVYRFLKGDCHFLAANLDDIVIAINEARRRKQLADILRVDVIHRDLSVEKVPVTVADCLQDFMAWLDQQASQPIRLDLLGIDMTYGWENMFRFLNQRESPVAHIRLVMLGPTFNAARATAAHVSATVEAWCAAANAQYDLMRNRLQTFREGHAIRLEVRRYRELPTYHGVAAYVGTSCRHYVTQCSERTGAVSDFGWGESEYRIIRHDEVADEHIEYRNEFDTRFEELWGASEPGCLLGC
jgi:hypothetical protein